jgi:hypothetical protein
MFSSNGRDDSKAESSISSPKGMGQIQRGVFYWCLPVEAVSAAPVFSSSTICSVVVRCKCCRALQAAKKTHLLLIA